MKNTFSDTTILFGNASTDMSLLSTAMGTSRVCSSTTTVSLGYVTVGLSDLQMEAYANTSSSTSGAAFDQGSLYTYQAEPNLPVEIEEQSKLRCSSW